MIYNTTWPYQLRSTRPFFSISTSDAPTLTPEDEELSDMKAGICFFLWMSLPVQHEAKTLYSSHNGHLSLSHTHMDKQA